MEKKKVKAKGPKKKDPFKQAISGQPGKRGTGERSKIENKEKKNG